MSLLSPIRSSQLAKGSEFFEISDEDTASDPQYFGYLNTSGRWIIQKRTASTGSYVYCQGLSDYSTNWTNRASLVYVSYSSLTTLV